MGQGSYGWNIESVCSCGHLKMGFPNYECHSCLKNNVGPTGYNQQSHHLFIFIQCYFHSRNKNWDLLSTANMQIFSIFYLNQHFVTVFQLLESTEWEELQTLELPDASQENLQLLLDVIYNGEVEATIEDLREMILLAHRLYISIPLSDELMAGLDLTLPKVSSEASGLIHSQERL